MLVNAVVYTFPADGADEAATLLTDVRGLAKERIGHRCRLR